MKSFITTFKLLASVGCLFLTFALAAQPQFEQWSLPPYLVDFTPGPSSALLPIADYSGQIPSNVSNSMYDENGNLLFFIVDYEIFDGNGLLIDYMQMGSNFIIPGSEISIVPKPGSCSEFYIIGSYRNALGTAWIPFYTLLDMNLPNLHHSGNFGGLTYFGSNTTIFDLSTLAPPKAFDEPLLPNSERNRFGLAITPFRQSTNDYLAFMKGFNPLNLYRYVVNASGIVLDATAPDLGVLTLPSTIQIGGDGGSNDIYPEMEIVDLQNSFYRIASIVGKNKILISNILYNNGMYVPSSTKEATLPVVQNFSDQLVGLEFTPDGNHLFYTYRKVDASGVLVSEHIGTVNLTNATIAPVDMSNSQFPGANILGFSFIELGHDNKLYYNDGSSLYSLDYPYAILPIYWGSPLLYGSSFQLLPDQMDGQEYQTILVPCDSCCTDSTAFFVAAQNVQGNEALGNCSINVVGSGLTPCMKITWDFGDGPGSVSGPHPDLTQLSYTYSATGTYTVCYLIQEFDNAGNPCWEFERCTDVFIICEACCTDSIAFFNTAQLIHPFTVINKCELSYTAIAFNDCLQITYDWDDGSSTGPLSLNGALVSHTYAKSGTYVPCWKIEEVNNGAVCWEYIQCDTVEIVCDTCYCKDPSFSNLVLHWDKGPGLPIQCETSYEGIPCPKPGKGYFLTGKFECVGDSCELDPYVSWDLEDPSGTHHFGSSITSPYFLINLLPAQMSQNGIYTMTLTSFCGTDTCSCSFQFIVDCGELCPCDIEDLEADVNTGFNYFTLPNSCQACFTPIALTDCDSVNWYVTDTSGTSIGSSLGNTMFCHTFPGSGTYTVFMEVTRKKSDGTICKTIRMSESVKIFCESVTGCDDSVFDNPTFSEGAITGGFNSGGASEGWTSILNELDVVKDQAGSLDGWTISMFGNLDNAGVLTTIDPICLERDTGQITIQLRGGPIAGAPYVSQGRGRSRNLSITLTQGNNIEIENCDEGDCFNIAAISMEDFVLGDWYEVVVPYDLRGWKSNDICGSGILIRPAIFITNRINTIQGGEDTYSYAQIDHFCMDGTIVAIHNLSNIGQVKIYPNPTTENLSIELPSLATSKMKILVMSIDGQTLLDTDAKPGNVLQTINTDLLPQGIFFLQIVSENRILSVNKFVKQ